MSQFDIIIPARYASSRLPGKPLRDVAGKTLLERVFDCANATDARRVIIATDDPHISDVAVGFGAEVVMTSADHQSGTDRLAEVIEKLDYKDDEIILNLQGDEPLVPRQLVHQVAQGLVNDPQASIVTICKDIRSQREYTDPSVVKVVINRQGYAMYFSRAPIPWAREDDGLSTRWPNRPDHVFHHIGLYAYRAGYLRRFANQSACDLELIEKLEQLRALWNGEVIRVLKARSLPGPGVDTLDDLENVIRIFQSKTE
ncbi:MAG: 3-deoxy-manno-octulosonate cytidylyltransferase (CMP-KDO synthetase) [Parasphingorhabdus sp.]|jgi:3-deoxy-manno-octulosonate cytidylyltransferase (CMP-KDO synthetase)